MASKASSAVYLCLLGSCHLLTCSPLDIISVSHWRPFAFLAFSPGGLGKVISSLPTSTSSRHGHSGLHPTNESTLSAEEQLAWDLTTSTI